MKNQYVKAANGTTYEYDLHTTKIYGTDKDLIKYLKNKCGLKSEYEVINLVLEYFTDKDFLTIDELRKENENQKKKIAAIRQEVMTKLALL